MDLGLRDRVVLLVGASSGIGAATARTLAAEGASLALVGRRRDALENVAATVAQNTGPAPLTLALDAGAEGAMEEAVARTVDRFGALHGLAVIAGPMGPRGALHDLQRADWQHYFDHGVMIAVNACKAALAPMRRQGAGAIVTTAAYSIRTQKPSLIAYTAAKSAIASLTKNIAKAYGPEGIRANCIAPGVVDVDDDAVRAVLAVRYGVPEAQARYEYVRREFGMTVALQRAGRHAEFADMITLLLSERASYVTGTTINIDGGTDF